MLLQERPKCKTIDECQALQDAAIEKEKEAASDAPPLPTQNGLRYTDLSQGKGDGPEASPGDTVTVKYKVLKAGKRSYDGLSGEATLIFSSGYELEDGEKPNSFFTYDLVKGNTVAEVFTLGVPGMRPGGVRRVEVPPQKVRASVFLEVLTLRAPTLPFNTRLTHPQGWRFPSADCDGGPGGRGSGGSIKTDYTVVPTAKVVQEEVR